MKYLVLFFLFALISGCSTDKSSYANQDEFCGNWTLENRGVLSDIEIKIEYNDKKELVGTISKLNEDKYVQMFAEVGDVLVVGVERLSNTKFQFSEKKLAAPLFSTYGQSTSKTYEVEFKGENKILLGKNGSNGQYLRLVE